MNSSYSKVGGSVVAVTVPVNPVGGPMKRKTEQTEGGGDGKQLAMGNGGPTGKYNLAKEVARLREENRKLKEEQEQQQRLLETMQLQIQELRCQVFGEAEEPEEETDDQATTSDAQGNGDNPAVEMVTEPVSSKAEQDPGPSGQVVCNLVVGEAKAPVVEAGDDVISGSLGNGDNLAEVATEPASEKTEQGPSSTGQVVGNQVIGEAKAPEVAVVNKATTSDARAPGNGDNLAVEMVTEPVSLIAEGGPGPTGEMVRNQVFGEAKAAMSYQVVASGSQGNRNKVAIEMVTEPVSKISEVPIPAGMKTVSKAGLCYYAGPLTPQEIAARQEESLKQKMTGFIPQFAAKFKEDTQEIRNLKQPPCVTLVSKEGAKFRVARRILDARCPVFKRVLEEKGDEFCGGPVELTKVGFKTVDVLIQYLEEGTLHPEWRSIEVIPELYEAAKEYELPLLFEFLEESLVNLCNSERGAETFSVLLRLAIRLGMDKAKQEIRTWLLEDLANKERMLADLVRERNRLERRLESLAKPEEGEFRVNFGKESCLIQ